MAKIGATLSLLFMSAMLSAGLGTAQAQDMPEPPHVFIGIASIEGFPAASGLELTAWDGARRIGGTTITEGGEFAINVSRAAGPISFRIKNLEAMEIYPHWDLGAVTRGFNLTFRNSLPQPTPTEPPHIFIGIARVNGIPAAPGTAITAWGAEWQIGMTLTTAGGEFAIQVSRTAGPISFRVNTWWANEISPRWDGGRNPGF